MRTKRIFIGVILGLSGGLLALALGYCALYAGALLFLNSLEGLFFEAEAAAAIKQGRIMDNPRGAGLREVRLEPAAGSAAELGFDSDFPYAFGRVRVRLVARPEGQAGGQVVLLITGRSGRGVLAQKQVLLDGAGQEISLEADMGLGIQRLEFWLRYRGKGALVVDCVKVSRPDPWPTRLWHYFRRIISSPFWCFWRTSDQDSPWRDHSLPDLYERVGLLRLTNRLTRGLNDIHQKAWQAYHYVFSRLADQWGRETCPYVGDTHWQVLVRGGGKCDTQAGVLGDMLAYLGLSSRVITSGFKPLNEDTHSVLEVAFPSGWGVFDPYLGFALMGPGGRPLSFREIGDRLGQKNPTPLRKGDPDTRENLLRAFYGNQPRTLNNRRPLVTGYNGLPRLAREWYGNNLQDHYLRDLRKEMKKEPPKLALARARNLHLFGRLAEAQRAYRRAEAVFKETLYKSAVAYYQAELALDQNKSPEACQRLRASWRDAHPPLWKGRLERALTRWGCNAPAKH
ncbi:MAG: transglutaminase domain-containing protein [Desulfarculus sp.]|nr:MAG: transglutaminase domain-containing protein [Desulfarculus sp.]